MSEEVKKTDGVSVETLNMVIREMGAAAQVEFSADHVESELHVATMEIARGMLTLPRAVELAAMLLVWSSRKEVG